MDKRLKAAVDWYHAGFGPMGAVPGEKRPRGDWRQYQNAPAPYDVVAPMLAAGDWLGLVLLPGQEVIDVEGRAVDDGTWGRVWGVAAEMGIDELLLRVIDGYSETSLSGGLHIIWRCDTTSGNQKLAVRPSDQVLIETRGPGGFVVVAPSPGYKIESGEPSSVARITADEREDLLTLFRWFDERRPSEEPPQALREPHTAPEGRPGDEFNERGNWREILEPHDWAYVRQGSRGETWWRRPGKSRGWSATTNATGRDTLIVHSSSTQFKISPSSYSKFAAYALLNHRGDHEAAARDLREKGYGEPQVSLVFEPPPSDDDVNPYDALYLHRPALESIPRGEPLIEDVIDRRSLVMLVGRDASFKSFIMLDWLLCVATGRPWQGQLVVQAPVLYVVGEGAYGLHDRVSAWEEKYERVDPELFTVRVAPVNLFKQADAFVDLLHRAEAEQYGLTAFDTLQRMSSGAEQNSAKDAGIIVSGLDRIRRVSGGSVAVVAHSGKSDSDARGSSALEDDLDIVWRVRRDEDDQQVKLWLDKRKDGPAERSYQLVPRLVSGTGSLVMQQFSADTEQPPPKHHLELLQWLAEAGEGGESKTTLESLLGIGTGTLYRATKYLEEKGLAVRRKRGQQRIWEITKAGLSELSKLDEKTENLG